MARLEELGFITHPHTSAGRTTNRQGLSVLRQSFIEAENGEVPRIDRSARAIEARVQTHVSRAIQAIRSAVDSLVELTYHGSCDYWR